MNSIELIITYLQMVILQTGKPYLRITSKNCSFIKIVLLIDLDVKISPVDAQDGSVTQDGVPDVHDTDSTGLFSKPLHVYNPS